MTVIARTGIHALRLDSDHIGRHYTCSCLLWSAPAELRAVPTATGLDIKPGVTQADARTRWQAHIDLLRLDCDRPWRWRFTRRSAA